MTSVMLNDIMMSVKVNMLSLIIVSAITPKVTVISVVMVIVTQNFTVASVAMLSVFKLNVIKPRIGNDISIFKIDRTSLQNVL
jgi:hypothetical protein